MHATNDPRSRQGQRTHHDKPKKLSELDNPTPRKKRAAEPPKVVEALLPDGSFKPGTGSAVALNVIRATHKYNERNSIDTEAYLAPIAYKMSLDRCFSRMNDDIL